MVDALAGDAPRGGVVEGGGSCYRSSRWGLKRGLRRGLLSTTSGVLEVPAGGLSPVEALALFATLCASVSVSFIDIAKL